jgi:putative FmdB family regulatory protein
MPIYEYKCLACGQQFELVILRASQPIACTACSSESVERLLSSFAVSSETTRGSSTASARKRNLELNSRQEPDKARIQIDADHHHHD